MNSIPWILPVLLTIACSSQTKELPKQDVLVVGTKVSLTPPDGFVVSSQFPGFEQESLGASIMVTEIGGPFPEVSAGFSSPSGAAKRGMIVVDKQAVTINGHSGVLLRIKQNASGIEFLKWLLVFGDEKESVMVTAAFPKQFEDTLSGKMKASILTAKWNKELNVPFTEGLNFVVVEKGDLKFAKRISNLLLYSKGGIFPSKSVDNPVFVVGSSFSRFAIDEREKFAEKRITQSDTVQDIQIEQSSGVIIDDLRGYELSAKGKDVKSGELMVVYQVLLFEEQTYYIIQGLVSEKEKQDYLATFKDMARSFKRKK